jgi:DNA-binding MarR family transcriptional regulator
VTNHRFGALEQLNRIDARIDEHQRQIDELSQARGHLYENVEKWATESDESMTKRLRANLTRKGLREVRYRIENSRCKITIARSLTLRVFEKLYELCRRAGFAGVKLGEQDLADTLGCSGRQLRRILRKLDDQGLIVRIPSPGDCYRYAIRVPECEAYHGILATTLDLRVKRLQAQSKVEANTLGLEPARSMALERFHDPGYQLPDGQLEWLRASYARNIRGLPPRT